MSPTSEFKATNTYLDIDSGYFFAGVTVRHPHPKYRMSPYVTKAAPVLKYMIGWTPDRVLRYVLQKGWDCTITEHQTPAD